MFTQIHFLIAASVWSWLRNLGGVGLVLLGLADNSVVPLPGSMDVLTIILAARHRELWWYYAGMATVGAVAGGYITYGLASNDGDSGRSRFLLFCRRPFPSYPFCWQPGPCSIRAKSLWPRSRSAAEFVSR